MAAFPPTADVPFDEAVVRHLTALDRKVAANAVMELIAGRREEDVRRAWLATRRARPDDVLGYFRAALGPRVSHSRPQPAAAGATSLQDIKDPYAS